MYTMNPMLQLQFTACSMQPKLALNTSKRRLNEIRLPELFRSHRPVQLVFGEAENYKLLLKLLILKLKCWQNYFFFKLLNSSALRSAGWCCCSAGFVSSLSSSPGIRCFCNRQQNERQSNLKHFLNVFDVQFSFCLLLAKTARNEKQQSSKTKKKKLKNLIPVLL